MKKWGLHHLTQLFNLLLAATDVAVCHIWLLLHLHHSHGRVDLGGQGDVDLVLVAIHTETANTAVFTEPERPHMYNKEHNNRDLAPSHTETHNTPVSPHTETYHNTPGLFHPETHNTPGSPHTETHSNRDQNHVTLKHNRPVTSH